jgi:hypothetical protein
VETTPPRAPHLEQTCVTAECACYTCRPRAFRLESEALTAAPRREASVIQIEAAL